MRVFGVFVAAVFCLFHDAIEAREFNLTDLSDLDGMEVGPSYGGLPRSKGRALGGNDDNPLMVYVVNRIKEEVGKYIVERGIAHVVRGVFHDCVGGCDGCINRLDPFNGGVWIQTIDMLDRFFNQFQIRRFMSRADFYTLSSIKAIENGYLNDQPGDTIGTPVIPFLYGRKDCPTSPQTLDKRNLPFAQMNHTQMLAWYKLEMDFDLDEVVAIMGAHTLGGADGSSGYLGLFTGGCQESNKWNSGYYKRMVSSAISWTHEDKSPITGFPVGRWMWTGTETATGRNLANFLNVDTSLFLDLQTDAEGQSACQFDQCRVIQDGLDEVEEYTNFRAWMAAFTPAFLKMTSLGAAPGSLMFPVF